MTVDKQVNLPGKMCLEKRIDTSKGRKIVQLFYDKNVKYTFFTLNAMVKVLLLTTRGKQSLHFS